jgi:transglutaminase-like putative cysteine protease
MRAIDRWRRLTGDEKIFAIRAAVSIAAMSIGLRVLGIKRMLAAEYADVTGAAHPDRPERIQALVIAVERAGRYVPGGTCLTQSLALVRMLRRRGIAADVRVGVRTDNGFHAHAWVAVNGVAITSEAGHEPLTNRT